MPSDSSQGTDPIAIRELDAMNVDVEVHKPVVADGREHLPDVRNSARIQLPGKYHMDRPSLRVDPQL
jgi:hypothetical protein